MIPATNTEHPFCTFVTQVQSQTPTKNALLSLRQSLKLNINVLLFCCWMANTGYRQLNKKDILDILAIISPWHEQIVLTLRKLRKHIQQRTIRPLPHKISKLILEKEITANQIEQLILSGIITKPLLKGDTSQRFNNACKNITAYAKELHAGMDQQNTEAIKQILSAIFPTIDYQQIVAYWGTSFTKMKNYSALQHSQLELDDFL